MRPLRPRPAVLVRAAYTGGVASQTPNPYEPLRAYLASQTGPELTLTFTAIEALLGTPLPDAAWQRAWWTNAAGVPQAHAWLRSGWRVRWVRRQGAAAAVTFSRAVGTRR